MAALPLGWDPERYDYLSDHSFFLCTWSIWDHSQFGSFVEVGVFSFLDEIDLYCFCYTCYGLYLDREDILSRLDECRRAERVVRAWQLFCVGQLLWYRDNRF